MKTHWNKSSGLADNLFLCTDHQQRNGHIGRETDLGTFFRLSCTLLQLHSHLRSPSHDFQFCSVWTRAHFLPFLSLDWFFAHSLLWISLHLPTWQWLEKPMSHRHFPNKAPLTTNTTRRVAPIPSPSQDTWQLAGMFLLRSLHRNPLSSRKNFPATKPTRSPLCWRSGRWRRRRRQQRRQWRELGTRPRPRRWRRPRNRAAKTTCGWTSVIAGTADHCDAACRV